MYNGVCMNGRILLTFALLLASLLYTTREAHGNGRFPRAQMIVAAPASSGTSSTGQTIWMRTTFGILMSADGGKSFRWICEKALGFTGQFDPPLTVLNDGRLIVGTDEGILSSVDGCSFTREPGIDGDAVRDLTTDASGATAYAITGARGKPGRVWKRDTSGKWKRLGKDYEDINFLTIDVAPSNPKRIYLTGEPWSTVRGEIWISNDGGATFLEQKNELEARGPFFLSYVDPKNQDHIVLRHLHFGGSDLVASSDGGKTLRHLVHWPSAMLGFAKSDDGEIVWIGSGDPKEGIWRSRDRGEHFDKMSEEGVYCLYARGRTLYACANPNTLGGYALGISSDEGRTLDKVSGFRDVGGALLCDAGPSLCEPDWPQTRAAILPSPDAGMLAEPIDAGAQAPATRTSCGCELAGAPSVPPWSILCLVGFIPLAMRGRPRRLLDRS